MKINKYTISNSPLQLRIAVLADIHDKEFSLAPLLGTERVDLILIPGDISKFHLCEEAWKLEQNELAEKYGISKKLLVKNTFHKSENAERILSQLTQIAPTYICPGNHEWAWNNIDQQVVESIGATLLDDTSVQIDSELIVCGWRTKAEINRHEFSTDCLNKFCKQEGFKILLMHEPHLYPEYVAGTSIDLTVSGHAHGGQWRFFGQGIFAPGQGLFPKYTKGLYENGRLLVSAGMANTTWIPRLFNPCEIVILELTNNHMPQNK